MIWLTWKNKNTSWGSGQYCVCRPAESVTFMWTWQTFFQFWATFQVWFLIKRGTPPELSILPVFPWITHLILGCCTKTFKMLGHSSLGLPCPDQYIPFLCINEKLCTFIIDKSRNFLRKYLLFGVREKNSTVLQISSLNIFQEFLERPVEII